MGEKLIALLYCLNLCTELELSAAGSSFHWGTGGQVSGAPTDGTPATHAHSPEQAVAEKPSRPGCIASVGAMCES